VDLARDIFTLMVVAGAPPGIALWFAIHPFARFWRRLGPGWTYAILMIPVAGYIAAVIGWRDRLLAVDFGTNPFFIVLALFCLAGASVILVKRRRLLTRKIVTGVPELSAKVYPGRLLTEGIYGLMRHPRYVEITLWTLAYTLFANHLSAWIVWGLSLPALWLVVVLEEAELRTRFGSEFEDYCRRVPRFIPHQKALGTTSTDD
jgi:protein-S-isoprenylcysteine O-methyltransferase Ste14